MRGFVGEESSLLCLAIRVELLMVGSSGELPVSEVGGFSLGKDGASSNKTSMSVLAVGDSPGEIQIKGQSYTFMPLSTAKVISE